VSVPAQIAVLLASTAELFDPVPIDQMTDAEHAVREAAAKIPSEMCARFETAVKLSDEDRNSIIEIARRALVPFVPKPESKPEAKPTPKPNPQPKAEAHSTGSGQAQTDGKSKPDAALKEKS